MTVNILDVQGDEVKFSCSFGEGVGICEERNLIVGMTYGIEIDILEDLKIGLNTEISNDKTCFLLYDGSLNLINVIVESLDEDDSICLRLAQDCIIVCYYVGGGILVGDTLLIKLKAQEFRITSIGVYH